MSSHRRNPRTRPHRPTRVLASLLTLLVLAASAAGAIEVGELAPELEVERWHNSPALELEALRGRVVILDFWGVWCVPCIAAVPELEAMQRRFGIDDLRIVTVHTPKKDDLIEAFVEEHDMTLPIAVDGRRSPTSTANYGDTTLRYAVEGFPTYVVIDRTGRVRAVAGSIPTEETIDDLLGE